MSFPRYPRYKDSGVEWLGEVPEHWGCARLKRIAQILPSNVDKKTYDGEAPVRLCNYTDVYYNDFITRDAEFMPATASVEQIERFTLRAGDTIITKDSETADDIAVAAYVTEDLPGVVCGYHLSLIRPRCPRTGAFIKRYFDSAFAKASVEVRANGLTRVGLTQYAIDNLLVPVPPSLERLAITDFLDRETSKIDTLISEQRRLSELLKEKRKAVISHAVTKGLDPDAPMKPSGVEWLGDVPAHWTTPPLYLRYEILLGKMLDEKRITGDALVPYIRNADVQWDSVNTHNLPEMDIPPHEWERFTLREGDLLVCEGGEVGRTAIWDSSLEQCGFQKALHRLRPLSADEHPRYLYYCMRFAAEKGIFIASGNPNTIPHLTGEKLRLYRFPTPPHKEQVEIAKFLDNESKRTDTLVDGAERAIALLQERRAALISAAVTGKIDVRGLAERAA